MKSSNKLFALDVISAALSGGKSYRKLVITSLAVVAMSTGAARAQLYDVNYDNGAENPTTGAAVVGTSTDQFNVLNASNNVPGVSGYTLDYTTNLFDSSGTTAQVPVTYTFSNTTEAFGVSEYGNSMLFPALEHGNITSYGESDFSFANLAPLTSYTFFLYATNNVNESGDDFTLSNGATTEQLDEVANQSKFVSTPDTNQTLVTGVDTYDGNYLALSGFTDASGDITFSAGSVGTPNPQTGAGGYTLTGFQVIDTAAVPEPGTTAMLVAGVGILLGILVRKRGTAKLA